MAGGWQYEILVFRIKESAFLADYERKGSNVVVKHTEFNDQEHFRRDPKICGGQLIIQGTRVPVRTILACLSEGARIDEILADFPTVKEADVKAVIAFAAASVQEDLPISEMPTIKPDEKPPHPILSQ